MRRAWHLTVALLAAVILLHAPVRAEEEPEGHRIVSVGGAVTEIVYALGAGDDLVAVDSTSLYPAAARDLPDVGYMRRLAAEPILALAPSVVLAVADAGPPAALEQIAAAGVRVVTVPDETSPEGVLAKVRTVADALGLSAEGEEMASRLEADFTVLRDGIAAAETRPSVLYLLSIGGGAPLAAGAGTAADGIIGLAGGRNAIDGFSDYKPLSPEAAVAAAPDYFLIDQRSLDALGGREALLSRPEVAATRAGSEGRLIAMDGLLLLGFGPRTSEAIQTLARALHPNLSLDVVRR